MSLVQGIVDTQTLPQVTALVRSATIPTALANPYSGAGALTPFGLGQVAYGLQFSVFDSPASAGRSSRSIYIFELEWLAITERVLMADASDVVLDTLVTRLSGGVMLFRDALPYVLNFSILEGWQASFHWLVAP